MNSSYIFLNLYHISEKRSLIRFLLFYQTVPHFGKEKGDTLFKVLNTALIVSYCRCTDFSFYLAGIRLLGPMPILV